MKRLLAVLLFLVVVKAAAQKEHYVWAYGNAEGVDFNAVPAAFRPSAVENYHHYSGAGAASICDKDGRLLFYTNGAKVWDRDGGTMPGGILLSGYPMGPISMENGIWLVQQSAAIAADPANRNRYYVFHTWRNAQPDGQSFSDTCSLLYSVVDMSLNSGRGAVVAAQKKVLIDRATTGALTVVRGEDCNAWVIAHDIAGNTFKAFELSVNGLNRTPVLSSAGLPSPAPYYFDNNPYLFTPTRTAIKISPDRRKLVHCSNQGYDAYGNAGRSFLQLFDFNAATGQVLNPLTLVNVPLNTKAVHDACFSNNSSKLYYAWHFPCLSCGSVSQFDLSLATPAAILASETYISAGVPVGISIKNAPDGRIYIAKSYGYSPPYAPAREGLFYIRQPELPGVACQFISNDLQFESFDDRTGALPNDIAILPRDTATTSHPLIVCGKDTLWLQVDTLSTNIKWWDNTSAFRKPVTQPGVYTLEYQLGCTDHFDTFEVRFQQMPTVSWDSAGCNDPATAGAYARPRDSTSVSFIWQKGTDIIRTRQSQTGDTIRGLAPGPYALRMITASGCDTTILFAIAPYPGVQLSVVPQTATITYGDSIQLQASGALLYSWWPSGTVSNDTLSGPFVRPLQPTVYTVMGLNAYGCRDSATVKIDIDYQMPVFIPNAFSPNGDGVNDIFRLDNISYQKLAAFRIFNRWGQQLFETGDPLKGWDGTQQGVPCTTGTYYYLVVVNYPNGVTRTFKGDLTLIR
ncbi:gliding motility-associated C-terminal domain-containing protein [Taibaiella koreensis]|uniref:gliding motility-associated C-terminal domain-containing protein n=1 Tax=Taibaiella koreensis TaxID=1268548 RepID=UPI000E59E48B|nr:gliding motility-associated C-terminal domain-containing protein [Taibaiella koreensis]